MGYGNPTAWGLCKFVPSKNYLVERIEFWTLDAAPDVDVYLYDSFNGRSVSGRLASVLDNSFNLAGYHSIKLPTPLRITKGNDIYLVVKITDASSNFPMPYDAVGPKTPGYCYISPNGSSFTQFPAGDLGLRLRVAASVGCGVLAQTPSVESIADVAGDRGGYVSLSWAGSSLDDPGAPGRVKMYKVWRRRMLSPGQINLTATDGPEPQGPFEVGPFGLAWEVVGTVPATGECTYEFTAPTERDANGTDTCWTEFYVSAVTGFMGETFDSPVVRGYSIDDGTAAPPGSDPDDTAIWETSLGTPQPNPSSGVFALKFEIAASQWTNLAVYDVRGRQVAVLLDGFTERGSHVARWQPAGAAPQWAPGVYFVRLRTGSEAHTARLLIAR
jgi:hypothetical protein